MAQKCSARLPSPSLLRDVRNSQRRLLEVQLAVAKTWWLEVDTEFALLVNLVSSWPHKKDLKGFLGRAQFAFFLSRLLY